MCPYLPGQPHTSLRLNSTVTIDIVTTENHNKLIWGFIFNLITVQIIPSYHNFTAVA